MLKDDKPRIKLEKDKEKEAHEDEWYLKQVDEHDGWKFVSAWEKEGERLRKRLSDDEKTGLESKKNRRFSYRRQLAEYGQGKLKEMDFPADWEFACFPTDGSNIKIYGRWLKSQEGVVFVLKTFDGRVFVRAIKMTYQPNYDFKALGILSQWAEDRIDSAKGLLLSDVDREAGLRKTKSGILVPK